MDAGMGPGPEFDLIRRILGSTAPRGPVEGVRTGPGDDCAVIAGGPFVLSSDMSVEGVHFRRDWLSAEEIGWRAAASALSDLAAMAARPLGLLSSLALPPEDAGEFAVRVMGGVTEAVRSVGGQLLGGDLTRTTGPLVLDVTVVGEAAVPILRSGARDGDELWVTGTLGGAALAVEYWNRGQLPDDAVRSRFARPQPRIREALWLTEHLQLTSMIDLSDGLAGDVAHIAASSRVALHLLPNRIPVHPSLAADSDTDHALQLAVSGGEDYELCFTATPGVVEPLVQRFEAEWGIPLSHIGYAAAGAGVYWRGDDDALTPLGSGGYQHFPEGK